MAGNRNDWGESQIKSQSGGQEKVDWGESRRMSQSGKKEDIRREVQGSRLGKAGVLWRLVRLVKPLAGYMVLAVVMGCIGFLCAQFIPIFGGYAVLYGLGFEVPFSIHMIWAGLVLFALLRAFLRFAEQRTNHFIAFTLLAIVRDKVFGALRSLCPAKLEGRDKGDLISLITSDVELLEVFYAHTVSPICIAFVVEVLMCVFIGSFHWSLGVLAFVAFCCVGVALPVVISRRSGALGDELRAQSGALAAFMLENIRGLDETIQYGGGRERLDGLTGRTEELSKRQGELNGLVGVNQALANTMILCFDVAMLVLGAVLYQKSLIGFDGFLISLVALMSSFGPVTALANLGTTLQATVASGARVLAILDEAPETEDIFGMEEVGFSGAECENVTFSYRKCGKNGNCDGNDGGYGTGGSDRADGISKYGAGGSHRADGISKYGIGESHKSDGISKYGAGGSDRTAGSYKYETDKSDGSSGGEMVLRGLCVHFPENRIVGVVGKSGCGKSTMLKLLMRFWRADEGTVSVSGRSVEEINTANLRDLESYMTQEVQLFRDTIGNNVRIGKPGATMEEVEVACKKAALHDFVMSLPDGYDTMVGELGATLSGGERQRIGLARAFLHGAPFMLLDEPTSNLDSLNEAVILRALKSEAAGKTVVLVTHRRSTVRIADEVVEMENGEVLGT